MNSPLPDLASLPASFAIKLPQLSAIGLTGEEQQKYLQGQVTCDVNELSDNKLLHGAHCDAKGKVLSVFRLVSHQQAMLLIQPETSIATSLAELKKFGVFAKVEIDQRNDLTFACLYGEQAESLLKAEIGVLPDELTQVVHHQNMSIAYIAGNTRRYLAIASEDDIDSLLSSLELPTVTEQVWQLLEINEGFPVMTENAVQHYVPQMLNLDKIHGISFTKGCYLGQETVARMQYLGKNKKMMALLIGHCSSTFAQAPALEKQLGDNWRSAGDVINYYRADNGQLYLQAVVASDLTCEDNLRLKGDEQSSLTLHTLPYTHI